MLYLEENFHAAGFLANTIFKIGWNDYKESDNIRRRKVEVLRISHIQWIYLCCPLTASMSSDILLFVFLELLN